MIDEIRSSALHDVKKFIRDSQLCRLQGWSINTNGEVDLRVRWRRNDDKEEDKWKPLEQLVIGSGRPCHGGQVC